MSEKPDVSWMKPAGIASISLGALAFVSAIVISDSVVRGFVNGLFNPLFFVGVPLGVYWLNRFNEFKSGATRSTSFPLAPLGLASQASTAECLPEPKPVDSQLVSANLRNADPATGTGSFVSGTVLGVVCTAIVALVIGGNRSKPVSQKPQKPTVSPRNDPKLIYVRQEGSLAGKRSVEVVVENLHDEAESAFISKSSLQSRVERRLRAAGISVDEKESGWLYLNVGTLVSPDRSTFGVVISLSYRQTIRLMGTGERKTIATTWETPSSFASVGRFRASTYVNETVDTMVGQFVNDFLAANGKRSP